MKSATVVTVGVAGIAAYVAYKLATDPNARQELAELGEKIKDGVQKLAEIVEEARGALERTTASASASVSD